MSRLSILGIILVTSLVTFVFANEKQKKKPVNWQPIISFNVPGMKAFIDTNSVVTTKSDNGKEEYNTAEVLISFDKDTEITIGKKKFIAKSLVKSLVIECTTGLSVPVTDLYFMDIRPTRESIPITGMEYSSDIKENLTTINKKSSLYHALCPVYI